MVLSPFASYEIPEALYFGGSTDQSSFPGSFQTQNEPVRYTRTSKTYPWNRELDGNSQEPNQIMWVHPQQGVPEHCVSPRATETAPVYSEINSKSTSSLPTATVASRKKQRRKTDSNYRHRKHPRNNNQDRQNHPLQDPPASNLYVQVNPPNTNYEQSHNYSSNRNHVHIPSYVSPTGPYGNQESYRTQSQNVLPPAFFPASYKSPNPNSSDTGIFSQILERYGSPPEFVPASYQSPIGSSADAETNSQFSEYINEEICVQHTWLQPFPLFIPSQRLPMRRRARAISIIDPVTGMDRLDEIYGEPQQSSYTEYDLESIDSHETPNL